MSIHLYNKNNEADCKTQVRKKPMETLWIMFVFMRWNLKAQNWPSIKKFQSADIFLPISPGFADLSGSDMSVEM